MSFSFEFHAKKADAVALVAKEHMPDVVREFVTHALAAFKDDVLVFVKGFGHLHNGTDHSHSSATIVVQPVAVRTAPTP